MKKFKKIYIEITNVCNLSCSFCPITNRKSSFMDIETFSMINEQIKGHTEHIYFHVKGEPLLHEQIGDFLDISYKNGFKVNITTNGTLIDLVKNKLFNKPALRQINISLHSFEANEKTQSIDEYLKNIIEFSKRAASEFNVIAALRLWNLDKDNAANIEIQRNRHILECIEKSFDLGFKIEEKICNERGIKLADKIFLNQDYEFKWPQLQDEVQQNRGFCYGLKDQAAILVDGTVVPCCLDGEGIIALGNIHNDNFSNIILGERCRNIINGFSRREVVEELCKNCTFRNRFN